MKNNKPVVNRSLLTLARNNWHILALALIAILSFWFNFYVISKTGYGNEYYAAAIKSMTQSFKNFFYVSFDPAGMVSVDKPPLGLWIQALFVLAFGYHGWAMLLPQALAGTASCIMMYVLTAKYFGRPAGLVSSLVFAITPIVVVASRNNTIDMQLVFVLLVAAWFLFKAIEKSKWRYLFAAALFVGLGFNIKMLQAYMILPAVALVYLIFAKEKLVKRIIAGVISLIIMAVVSFAWVFAVDLTPATNRPYVDSSTDNSVLELIIGHNGLERLYGQGNGSSLSAGGGKSMGKVPTMENGGSMGTPPNTEGGQGGGTPPSTGTKPSGTGGQANQNGGTPPEMPTQGSGSFEGQTPPSGGTRPTTGDGATGGGNQGQSGGGGGQSGTQNGSEIGSAGVLRLWSSNLYGQASWLLVFALFGILAGIHKFNIKKLTLKQGVFVFWILSLATMFVFFSFASFYHRYYLCMMAPAISALSGIGLSLMVKQFKQRKGWRQFILPVSLLATDAIEIVHVWSYPALRVWLVPIMAMAGVAALVLMAVHYVKAKRLVLYLAIGCMLVSMLAAPFYWALTPVMNVPNTTMPYAGPELVSQGGNGAQGKGGGVPSYGAIETKTSGLEKYLVAHYKKGSFLVISQRADDVAQYIVDTGLPAVAYGGFLGSDNSMTVAQLKKLVAEGKATYFLVSSQSGNSNSDLISYVEKSATLIDATEYGGTSAQSGSSTSSVTSSSSSSSSNSSTSSSTNGSANGSDGGSSGSTALYCFK